MEKYQRQIILPNFGAAAQHKLQQSAVLVVGAGGLGCPALIYLAAAGVASLGVVDGDVVQESNLNRQVIFGLTDVGLPKAEVASDYLSKKFGCKVIAYPQNLNVNNCFEIFEKYDVVIDCTDDIFARYLINDTCVVLNMPWVYGAVYRNQAQIATFNLNTKQGNSANYRHFFKTKHHAVTCNDAGILGTVTGVVGSLQAQEAIKIITHWKKPIVNELAVFDVSDLNVYKVKISNLNQTIPNNRAEWDKIYLHHSINEISYEQALQFGDTLLWIDVREVNELPTVNHIKYPLDTLSALTQHHFREHENVLFVCNSGIRSKEAAILIKQKFPYLNIYSLQGGILNFVS